MQLKKYGITGKSMVNERATLKLTFSGNTGYSAINLVDKALKFRDAFVKEHGEDSVREWEPSDRNTGYSVTSDKADAFLEQFNTEFN